MLCWNMLIRVRAAAVPGPAPDCQSGWTARYRRHGCDTLLYITHSYSRCRCAGRMLESYAGSDSTSSLVSISITARVQHPRLIQTRHAPSAPISPPATSRLCEAPDPAHARCGVGHRDQRFPFPPAMTPAAPSRLHARYGPWALVTGASSGIGREYARELARHGLNVVLVARRQSLLDELADELRDAYGVRARVIVADLSTPTAVARIVRATADLSIGILVNNAGAAQYGSFFKDSADYHAGVLNVNVVSPVALARAFGGHMRDRGQGGIIFTSSTAATLVPYFATYAASKSCISDFSRLLGFELRPFGVDVLCVEPGFVETEMGLLMVKDIDIRRLTPCARPVSPARVAQAALQRLGTVSVFTPGSMPRLSKIVARMLPTQLRMCLVSRQIREVMSPKLRNGLEPVD